MPRPARLVPGIDSALRGVPPGTSVHAELFAERALANLRRNDRVSALEDLRVALDARVLPAGPTAVLTTVAAQCVLHLERTDLYDGVERELADLPPISLGKSLDLWTDLRTELVRRLGCPPALVAHLLATAPRFTGQDPPPPVRARWTRAMLRYEAGDVRAALAEIDQLLAEPLEAHERADVLLLGARCIAVLDDSSRFAEAGRWADELRTSAGPDGPDLAVRFTCAAIAAVGGAGAGALTDLEEGLAQMQGNRPERVTTRAHAILARAHLDAGHIPQARHHLEIAERGEVPAPVAVRVRADLEALGHA